MTDKPQPPSSGPGRPKDPLKHQAILEAAKCLFLRHGYDGISMDAIAGHAGVSKLTVYSHFTDKETLFCEAVKAKCAQQLPELIFKRPPGASIESVLLNIGQAFHALINSEESIELHRLMLSLANQQPKLPPLFFEAGAKRLLDGMENLLRRAARDGLLDIDDPQVAADQFFALFKGCDNFRVLIGCADAKRGDAAEKQVRDAVTMFLRAYAPPPGQPRHPTPR